jgi:hypothetical protein
MPKHIRFPQILCEIRRLSGTLHSIQVMGRAPVFPDGTPAPSTDVLEADLRSFLKALPPGVLYLLLTLYYIARGYRGPRRLLDLYTMLSDRFPKHSQALDDLLQDPPYVSCRVDYGLRMCNRARIHKSFYFAGAWTIAPNAKENP